MKYKCPECSAGLSTHKVVLMVGEHDKKRSLFVFDARPGKYDFVVVDDIEVRPGTMWEFYCPVCWANLTTSYNKRLAKLEAVDEEGSRRVVFSKVAGEQSTFVLGGEELEAHGRDSLAYIDKKDE
jgi:hypothetical protein